MKSFQVLNAQPILTRLVKADLPIKASVALTQHFKAAFAIHQLVVDQRASLFEKYGARDEENKVTEIPDENKPAFCAAYTNLMELELDWDLPPIDMDIFDGSGIQLTCEDATKIDWWIGHS